MCINRIRNKFRNFSWKRALVSLAFGSALILGGGIPLAISHGMIAFLAYSSIVVALYAIFVSMKSLQLTRETQRPFVTVTNTDVKLMGKSKEKTSPAIWLTIRNTGSLPAEKIYMRSNFVEAIGDSNQKVLHSEERRSGLLFPMQEFVIAHLLPSVCRRVLAWVRRWGLPPRRCYFHGLQRRTSSQLFDLDTPFVTTILVGFPPSPSRVPWGCLGPSFAHRVGS